MGPGMMGWNMGWGWGWIMMGLFWALVVLGIVALVRWLAAQGGSHSRSAESALEILRRRYAGGEISQEDFRRMKEDILGRGA